MLLDKVFERIARIITALKRKAQIVNQQRNRTPYLCRREITASRRKLTGGRLELRPLARHPEHVF